MFGSAGALFDWECPRMMNMGVPYDLYWHGDPFIVRHYIDAYELSQERTFIERDAEAWLTGSYIHDAVASVLSQAFGGSKTSNYPTEPRAQVERLKSVDPQSKVLAELAKMKHFMSVYNATRKGSRDGADASSQG